MTGFDTARRTDPDVKQMTDVVQQLEASLQDCAVHGLRWWMFRRVPADPCLLNRWNSSVLDGLWQAVTGRTPDGVTPFALNPPDTTAELLNRLVWPKAYPAAVDLVVEIMGLTQGDSLVWHLQSLRVHAQGTLASYTGFFPVRWRTLPRCILSVNCH